MTLNRASKKEAETRFAALRKQVSLHVFTLRFEDSLCRESRTAAEELAESTSRLSVEISDAMESGDLLRKYRVDSPPALVVSAKDVPDLRLYGAPTGYALPALLEAIVMAGSFLELKEELVESARLAISDRDRAAPRLDLLVSRHEASCLEASGALWRSVFAERLSGTPRQSVASVRIVEDFPHWALRSDNGRIPVLLVDGAPILHWPFTDMAIIAALREGSHRTPNG